MSVSRTIAISSDDCCEEDQGTCSQVSTRLLALVSRFYRKTDNRLRTQSLQPAMKGGEWRMTAVSRANPHCLWTHPIYRSSLMICAPNSATPYTTAMVLLLDTIGTTLASHTRRFLQPYTRSRESTTPPISRGIIEHEPTQWFPPLTVRRI